MRSTIWRSADRSNRSGRRRTGGRFRFPRGRLVGHTDDARHLAGARGDAHAPDGGGTRLRGLDGLLQERGRFYLRVSRSCWKTTKDSDQQRGLRRGPSAGRDCETGDEIRAKMDCAANSESARAKSRLRQGCGGGRKAGREHILAIAHTFADDVLEFFGLGAALPAGFQMGADLACFAAGQFAIQVAQAADRRRGGASRDYSSRTFLSRTMARRRNSLRHWR